MIVSRLKSRILAGLVAAAMLLSACQAEVASFPPSAQNANLALQPTQNTPAPDQPIPTPFPTRPLYSPGELVDYTAQAGDTLPALASRFNTTVDEILAANTFIPRTATTMPPGMPMKIPIYYLPL